MLFHYALVDDLISKEEFEERVAKKIDECGDLVDEPTAAMLVIGELGRQHVKIRELSGRSSLFSFFGKVIDKTDPREFERQDGQKGWVANLLLADETGTIRVVLWDEKAGAAGEVLTGDVLEVIGRHPGRTAAEIYALALRKASCEISCTSHSGAAVESLSAERVDLEGVLIARGERRTFTRKDGTTGEMVEILAGDARGTARCVVWVPELLDGILPGLSLSIRSAKPDRRSGERAYSLDEKSSITVTDRVIEVPFDSIGSVGTEGTYSIQAEVTIADDPRSFTDRNGSPSWVRNIMVSDGNDDLNVVLWGEKALLPIGPGDNIEVFHASAKPGRSGRIELGAGRGSHVVVPGSKPEPIVFEGMIIAMQGCTFIDNGTRRYVVEDCNLPHGSEAQVSGTLSGNRIIPAEIRLLTINAEALLLELHEFRRVLEA